MPSEAKEPGAGSWLLRFARDDSVLSPLSIPSSFMTRRIPTAAAVLLLGCTPARPAAPTLSNRVWRVSASPTVELGTLYAFLAESTLVISSPHGTPSLGSWHFSGDSLVLVEEGIPYKAEVLSLTADGLTVRIHNPGEPVEITFVPAEGGGR